MVVLLLWMPSLLLLALRKSSSTSIYLTRLETQPMKLQGVLVQQMLPPEPDNVHFREAVRAIRR
jgi:hypothetical protein